MKFLLAVLFSLSMSGAATTPCTTAPCSFNTNVEWTPLGTPDPNFWGNDAAVTSPMPFSSVPAGYSVQITHVSGDEIAAAGPNQDTVLGEKFANRPPIFLNRLVSPRVRAQAVAPKFIPCVPVPNSISYVLFSLTNTTPVNQNYSTFEQGAAMIVHQMPVPGTSNFGAKLPFDADVSGPGLLNADNILKLNQALFLSTTGCPVHMELTLLVSFKYVPATGSVAARKAMVMPWREVISWLFVAVIFGFFYWAVELFVTKDRLNRYAATR